MAHVELPYRHDRKLIVNYILNEIKDKNIVKVFYGDELSVEYVIIMKMEGGWTSIMTRYSVPLDNKNLVRQVGYYTFTSLDNMKKELITRSNSYAEATLFTDAYTSCNILKDKDLIFIEWRRVLNCFACVLPPCRTLICTISIDDVNRALLEHNKIPILGLLLTSAMCGEDIMENIKNTKKMNVLAADKFLEAYSKVEKLLKK